MNKTSGLVTVLLAIFLFFHRSESSCCYGIRKVCETLSDIALEGNDEWKSLVISPGKCENSTKTPTRETITSQTFSKVTKLTNVYIVDTVVEFEEKSLQPLENNLIYFNVIKNNMTVLPNGVFQDLPKLKKLVLRDSSIETISSEAFKNLPKLEILLLSGNLLRGIQTGILNIVNVKSIDLSFNTISNIEKNSFPNNLIILNLKKNELVQIEDETFSNLNSLEMLILSKNKIKTIRKGTFAGLSNLSKLDLSRNEIATIEKDTFSDLQELMFLYLKNNQLHVLKADVFLKDMINLTDLELEQNSLTYLSEDIFKRAPNLEEISIGGNPWQCKCLENIVRILSNRSISMSDTEERIPKCVKMQADKCNESE